MATNINEIQGVVKSTIAKVAKICSCKVNLNNKLSDYGIKDDRYQTLINVINQRFQLSDNVGLYWNNGYDIVNYLKSRLL